MGRAPCCDKKGMKKGPWTPEEDQILISYIHQHGHSNWRALPKQAGLLRCGKSCRLRWVNYLSPDIKRGNFGPEEEEAIIKLHEMLGNRWSAIASRLPGRTDNEIKNVWHTHLKKRVNEGQSNEDGHKKKNKVTKTIKSFKDEENNNFSAGSPQQSTTTATTTNTTTTNTSSLTEASSMESFPEIDESFWTENLSIDDFEIVSMVEDADQLGKFGFEELGGGGVGGVDDVEMDFWYNVFIQSGGFTELPEF